MLGILGTSKGDDKKGVKDCEANVGVELAAKEDGVPILAANGEERRLLEEAMDTKEEEEEEEGRGIECREASVRRERELGRD